jgi:hypothetical protein
MQTVQVEFDLGEVLPINIIHNSFELLLNK